MACAISHLTEDWQLFFFWLVTCLGIDFICLFFCLVLVIQLNFKRLRLHLCWLKVLFDVVDFLVMALVASYDVNFNFLPYYRHQHHYFIIPLLPPNDYSPSQPSIPPTANSIRVNAFITQHYTEQDNFS